MSNNTRIIFWSVAIILFILLVGYRKLQNFEKDTLRKFRWWLWTREQFTHYWFNNEITFGLFWDMFLATIAIYVALKLAGINGVAMDYFLIASIVFMALALLTRMRIDVEKKNNSKSDKLLDKETAEKLIKSIEELTQKLSNLNK